MSDETGVEIDGLWFRYPGKPAANIFEDFSLGIDRSRITAVLGPSGLGKSTLLNLIAGTLKPERGSIRFHQKENLIERPPIGLVFQSATLIPWRNVLSNVLFGVEINRRVPRLQAVDHARRLFKRHGLREFERRMPFELSGGMQQRVSVIRALVSEARILLLDEPFSNLDFLARRLLQQDVSEAVDRLGIAAVLVTHDLNDALRLGDRIIVAGERPFRVIDSFDIATPRSQRLSQPEGTNLDMQPYFERIWRSWTGNAGARNVLA